ncbi:MAG TPA: glycosyltransferase family 25 protein [Pyrinomonadaceae bacterium]|nr:glycosyltransferase family 25 protein [Pyrinomonadaceae bacterium]
MGINEAFPHKFCINLDRRPERWEQMRAKFERYGIEGVQRFAAVDGEQAIVPPNWKDSPGAYGCLRSHLEIIKEARRLGWPSVLIFEDDAALDAELHDKFSFYFEQVPSDWEMLHFGANHMAAPVAVAANVVRITSANSTFAYALNRNVFDSFIELNTQALTAVDLNNRTLQTEHACYCFMPHLAWVEDLNSDVQVRQKYHWYLKESLVLHGTEMDQILGRTAVIITDRGDVENLNFLKGFYEKYLPGIEVIVGAGLDAVSPDRSFLIFTDSNVFVEEWDIRGNLRMCERFDCATGFRSLVNLTHEATRMLRTSKPMILTPWFDANDYQRSEKREPFERFAVFKRDAVSRQDLTVFESPNDALLMA